MNEFKRGDRVRYIPLPEEEAPENDPIIVGSNDMLVVGESINQPGFWVCERADGMRFEFQYEESASEYMTYTGFAFDALELIP